MARESKTKKKTGVCMKDKKDFYLIGLYLGKSNKKEEDD